MSPLARRRRARQQRQGKQQGTPFELPTWFLSFCGGEPERNLGCAVVRARSLYEAALVAKGLDANPGGEALGFQVPTDLLHNIPAEARDRLLQLEEAERLMGEMVRVDSNGDEVHEPW